MDLLGSLTAIFKPLNELVDNVHTSTEEKLELKAKLVGIKNQVTMKALELERELLESKTKIITTEAQGESWIQRNWRPITMLTFLVLVVFDAFGWTEFRLSEQAWTLLQIGLGGYVVSRGVEKVTPQITDAIKARN